MSRLFTFGCSYTDWNWPTWADMLGRSYDEFENWAIRGTGNRAIAERISECILSKQIGVGDTVVVQWTNFHRFDMHGEDILPNTRWRCSGNIHVNPWEDRFVKESWREKSYCLHSLNFIHMAMNLLKNTGCQFLVTSHYDIKNEYKQFPELDFYDSVKTNWLYPIQQFTDDQGYKGKQLKIYQLNAMLGKIGILRDEKKTIWDHHPGPEQHYQWLKTYLLPKLNVELDEEFCAKSIKVFSDLELIDSAEIFQTRMNWTPIIHIRAPGL